jgi:anti-sigma factor RsiW
MKCHDVLDRVDEYLDGRLDTQAAKAFDEHVAKCSVCNEELESLIELRARVDRLPRSMEVPRDLWPGIESAIENAKVVRAPFGRRALLAVAAVALLAISVTTAYLVGRNQAVPVAQAPVPPVVDEATMLHASFTELGVSDYRTTRDELLEALEARRHELSPETQEILTENLRVIDEAMARIAEALGENPESEFLLKQLAGAYRQQIGLLQRAVRLPAEV